MKLLQNSKNVEIFVKAEIHIGELYFISLKLSCMRFHYMYRL